MFRAWFLATSIVAAALAMPTLVGAHEKSDWFDLQGCAICKHLGNEKGLIDNIGWETHLISNGMLSVSTIPKDFEQAMQRAHENMEQVVKKLEAGELMPLCAFCQSYGKLMQAGAKSEEIKTSTGVIHLFTSDDPELVKQIQEHAERTIEEHEKMKAHLAEHAAGG